MTQSERHSEIKYTVTNHISSEVYYQLKTLLSIDDLIYTFNGSDKDWYKATDVCGKLGFSNPARSTINCTQRCDREQYIYQGRAVWFITLIGCYDLTMASKSEIATTFKNLVKNNMLPEVEVVLDIMEVTNSNSSSSGNAITQADLDALLDIISRLHNQSIDQRFYNFFERLQDIYHSKTNEMAKLAWDCNHDHTDDPIALAELHRRRNIVTTQADTLEEFIRFSLYVLKTDPQQQWELKDDYTDYL